MFFCYDTSSQSDTRLIGLLGTPGSEGQKGEIVRISDEIWRNFEAAIYHRITDNLSLPPLP